jgi:hypothetical protein
MSTNELRACPGRHGKQRAGSVHRHRRRSPAARADVFDRGTGFTIALRSTIVAASMH